jgi:hypothetical protein
MGVHVFGIRHHGPGCARSLVGALRILRPDIVLIEGPPDADDIVTLLSKDSMKPPVALLLYPPDCPQRAVFYPLAVFSPEWQALRYAQEQHIPARFMDLPQSHRLALESEETNAGEQSPSQDRTPHNPDAAQDSANGLSGEASRIDLQDDPLGVLSLLAGYSDRELWWEQQVEQRQDPSGLFEAIMEAMIELRAHATVSLQHEAQREASMRQTIRATQKEGFDKIAVICGAWHAPVLANFSSSKADAALLKGLPKTKVIATWIPWTYSRLASRSGYGAGVTSPGWYHHLWASPDRAPVRWAIYAARLLRGEDLDASSAAVIETVRLADALAALRALPMPGLQEMNEALLAVLCGGDPGPLRLIRDRLEVGDQLGTVPDETPTVPLQRDLEAQQRRLRLPPTSEIKTLDLDLRKDKDRARSRLLHQLQHLGIPWGQPQPVSRKSGTFHELWQLRWQVEFVVALIEASMWGNTVESAASAAVQSRADQAQHLAELTALVDSAVLAGLPAAIDHVLNRLQAQAAVSADVQHLMDALPALARVARYGDVRQTPTGHVVPILDGLFERIVIGLPGACASLDEEAAGRMMNRIGSVQESVDLLDNAHQRQAWQQVLQQLLANDSTAGLIRGRCCRLLLEQRVIDAQELQSQARLQLSPAVPPLQAAAWIEGLLFGSGLMLLHQDPLWNALDGWLGGLAAEAFIELLPVLRRAFAGFQPPERRSMTEKVKRLTAGICQRAETSGVNAPSSAAPETLGVDRERADRVLPVLAQVLGVKLVGHPNHGK